jgi:hypothetical protein
MLCFLVVPAEQAFLRFRTTQNYRNGPTDKSQHSALIHKQVAVSAAPLFVKRQPLKEKF